MSFKGQLLSAMLLNVLLKFFTFALNVFLTRQLTPSENGINFSCQLYFNTVLFLARECVRSVNARKNLLERAGNGEAVLQVMNCAFVSLPLGIFIMLLFDLLPVFGINLLPSLAAFSSIGETRFSASAVKGGEALSFVSMGFPELLLASSVVIILSIEPCFALVQSFDYIGNVVASEFWALLTRLVVCLVFLKVRGGLGDDQYLARMCFATGTFSYSIATVVYFLGLWNRSHYQQGDEEDSKQNCDFIQRARKGAVKTRWGIVNPCFFLLSSWSSFLRVCLPWSLLSWRAAYNEIVRDVSLMRQFFSASCLQLFLAEGERFTLATCGSAVAMGHYDLVANLGSLVARILFRVWENACFVKWSRDAARGRQNEAVALFLTMLRVALYFGAAVLLLAPPLAEEFLCRVFSYRWASPAAVRALRSYCCVLPLMGLYGLLDAFLRATASPAVLHLTQRVMVAQAALYVAACVVVLRPGLVGDPVTGLIVVNGVCMALRCVSSVALLLLASPKPRALSFRDFGTLVDKRIASLWTLLFFCTRLTTQTTAVTIMVAPVYAAAVAMCDIEIRVAALRFLRNRGLISHKD